jgi:hypothetical protein
MTVRTQYLDRRCHNSGVLSSPLIAGNVRILLLYMFYLFRNG